jgi:hypothetical protein
VIAVATQIVRSIACVAPDIQSVEFQAMGSPLDPNPGNGNPNTNVGSRIFPDKLNPADALDSLGPNRAKVRVIATVFPAQAGVKVNFKTYDMDDPSANTLPLDDESLAKDNRGNIGGFKEGKLDCNTGLIPSTTCSDTSGNRGYAMTDSNGIAKMVIEVTKQPGDNFAVAVSKNSAYLNSTVVNGLDLRNGSQTIPISGTTTTATPSNPAIRTQLLTVWRKLHIEVDSMGVVPSTGNQKNLITGTIASNITLNTGQSDYISLNVSPDLENNRFDDGRMEVGGRSFRIPNSTPTGTVTISNLVNTENTILIDNDGDPFTFSVGQSFTLYDDDDMDSGDGENPHGDTGEDVGEPDTSWLAHTDTVCTNTSTGNCNSLGAAYIKPYYDLPNSNNNIPFSRNTIDSDRSAIYTNHFNNVTNELNPDFWTVYLLGAYQPSTDEDSDPDESDATYGRTDDIASFTYMELNRAKEYNDIDRILMPLGFASWRDRPVGNKYNTAHEIGHLFGGDHDDCQNGGDCRSSTPEDDAGLMTGGFDITKTFKEKTLKKMRDTRNP